MKRTIIVLMLMLSLGCVGQEKASTEEDSLEIAQEFVLTSPTYTYDGENLTHVETMTLRCPSCWQFVFEFTSLHGGYGDRSDQVTLPVITYHRAVVTVEEGRITYAVLDSTWDMLSQETIE